MDRVIDISDELQTSSVTFYLCMLYYAFLSEFSSSLVVVEILWHIQVACCYLENPMHVTSFQGRVACRFYPLEGFKHETEKHPPLICIEGPTVCNNIIYHIDL